MPAPRIFKRRGFEQSAFPVLSRVLRNGVPIIKSDITSISVTVRRFSQAGAVSTSLAATAVTVSTSVFDTLQTGGGWTEDPSGYNFSYTIDKAAFPGPDAYEIVFLFTPADGGNPFPVVVEATMLSLQGAV